MSSGLHVKFAPAISTGFILMVGCLVLMALAVAADARPNNRQLSQGAACNTTQAILAQTHLGFPCELKCDRNGNLNCMTDRSSDNCYWLCYWFGTYKVCTYYCDLVSDRSELLWILQQAQEQRSLQQRTDMVLKARSRRYSQCLG